VRAHACSAHRETTSAPGSYPLATGVADRGGLVLRIVREGRQPAGSDPWRDPASHFAFVTGTGDWARHEVAAQIPPDASLIIFGVFLNRRGQIELRNPQLAPGAGSIARH
jgi:hypothetical protein